MRSDTFYLPTRIRTGKGAFESLGTILASCGRRGLLVCGQHAVRSGLVNRARSLAQGHDVGLGLYVRAGREPTNPRKNSATVIGFWFCGLSGLSVVGSLCPRGSGSRTRPDRGH